MRGNLSTLIEELTVALAATMPTGADIDYPTQVCVWAVIADAWIENLAHARSRADLDRLIEFGEKLHDALSVMTPPNELHEVHRRFAGAFGHCVLAVLARRDTRQSKYRSHMTVCGEATKEFMLAYTAYYDCNGQLTPCG